MRGSIGRMAVALAAIGILTGLAGTAAAAEGKVCSICAVEPTNYPEKATKTLLRGGVNTLLGWTELFRQPVQETKAGGNVVTGIAHGVGHTVTRTLSGVGDVLTFWTPKVKGEYMKFSKDCPVCMGQSK